MLNPDGVVYGNYRCSLLGFDLNRKWKTPSRLMQPTVYCAKQMVKYMSEEREISLFCDFHAHSTEKNIFMYGCSYQPTEFDHLRKNAAIRVVPLLMSQQNRNFSYRSSRFRMEKYKEATARIVVFKEFEVTNSYTCESSFFSSIQIGGRQIRLDEYEKIGESICRMAMTYMPFSDCRARLMAVMHKITTVLYERYLNAFCTYKEKNTVQHNENAEENKGQESNAIHEEKAEPDSNPQLPPKEPTYEEKPFITLNQKLPREIEKAVGEDLLPAADLELIVKEVVEEDKSQGEEGAESDDDITSTESESEIRSRILARRKKKVKDADAKKRKAPKKIPKNALQKLKPVPKCPQPNKATTVIQKQTTLPRVFERYSKDPPPLETTVTVMNNPPEPPTKKDISQDSESYPLRIVRMTTNSIKAKNAPKRVLGGKTEEPHRYASLNKSTCVYKKPQRIFQVADAELNLKGLRIGNSKELNKTQNSRYYYRRQKTTENVEEIMTEPHKDILSRPEFVPLNCEAFCQEYTNTSKKDLLRRCSQQTKVRLYNFTNLPAEREKEYLVTADQSLSKLRRPQKSTRFLKREGQGERKLIFFLEGRAQIHS